MFTYMLALFYLFMCIVMKGGVIGYKKEMTRVLVDGKMVSVTLVEVPSQEVIRKKTIEKDGYEAFVLGEGGYTVTLKNGKKATRYRHIKEFTGCADDFTGSVSDDIIDTKVSVVGITKGKGYQGVMKRCNASGGPETHGSKFHRAVGSTGNMKPRRVMKGHPHAGRMGTDKQTLHNKKVLNMLDIEGEKILVIAGSLPGGYNNRLYITF